MTGGASWDGGASSAGPLPTVVDTDMLGRAGITAAFVVRGRATALVETGPRSSLAAVLAGLARAGVESLDHIVVTHIHLDHAGGAGALARRFPDALVWVHPRGAPHLADPSRLWSSAARIYGDAMERMWGGVDPVDRDRIVSLEDGGRIDLGGRSLRAVETPGHASHHHALLDEGSGILFAGDALGVRLPDIGVVRAATPPPEFDLSAALSSVARIAATRPTAVWPTHYGGSSEGVAPLEPAEMCAAAEAALRSWAEWAEEARAVTRDLDEAAALVERRARAGPEAPLEESQVERLEATTSYRMNTWGLLRYLDKRSAGAGAAPP
ncbi:MAG TPA: MBL fold metallo-hydrolase [Actinomycetota bacterium]|nr:MBL fold metallo-hydrolase [Actinomycetota bacterium]